MNKIRNLVLTIMSLITITSIAVTFLEVEYDLISKIFYPPSTDEGYYIEYVDDGSFELIDSDYDGNIDESYKYDLDGNLMFSKLDSNYDGYLETKVYFEEGRSTRSLVDTDKNRQYDLVFLYGPGSKYKAMKFQKSSVKDSNVDVFELSFGFPSRPSVSESIASEKEFSETYDRN